MSLKRWFKEKWTAQDGSDCGDYKGKGRVKCRPSKVVSKKKTPQTWGQMSKSEKKKAVSEKQKAHRSGKMWSTHKDGGKTWGGGDKVKYEATIREQGGKRKLASHLYAAADAMEAMYFPEEKLAESKNVPTNPALYNRIKAQVKAKEKVYPSAYANGRIVKMYKARGGGFRKEKSEKNASIMQVIQGVKNIGLKNTGKLTAQQAAVKAVPVVNKATNLAHNRKLHDFIGLDNISANLPYWGVGTVMAPSSAVTMPMTAASMIVPKAVKGVMKLRDARKLKGLAK